MRKFASILLILTLGLSQGFGQDQFNYEQNKQLLIERALIQYLIILHSDRYDQSHLDGFCADAAKGADLPAIRETAKLVPEEFNWTNRDAKAITDTPFRPGSIYTVELECTDGSTATTKLIVIGEVDKPYLVIHEHLRLKG
jgi:hypothetical protein